MRLRHLAPSLLAAVCLGGEAVPVPVAELRLADGQQIIQRWNASLYAQVWNDPAAERLRSRWAGLLAKAQEQKGWEPVAVLTALRHVQARVVAQGDDPAFPAVLAQAELADLAAPAFTALAEDGEPSTLAGADQAVVFENGKVRSLVTRFGGFLLASVNRAAPTSPAALPPAADELAARVDLGQLKTLLTSLIEDEDSRNELLEAFDQMQAMGATGVAYRMRLLPEGVWEHFDMPGSRTPWSIPVDRTLLGRMPGNTLMAGGVGFDGQAYWQHFRKGLLKPLAQARDMEVKDDADLDRTEQEIDQIFREQGLSFTLAQLVQGLKGTLVVGITPGIPFPALVLVVPRSAEVDAGAAKGLALLEAQLPAEGDSAMLAIPNFPVPVTVARDKTHWLITSDPMLPTAWLSGAPGGWSESGPGRLALAKAAADATQIGASDTPQVLRVINGYLGMGLGFIPNLEAADKQAILALVGRLADRAQPGYVVGGPTPDGGEAIEMRGVLGVSGTIALVGTVGWVFSQSVSRFDGGLEEGRESADPNLARATLKSAIFPAQVQFQAGTYVDQDADGRGEYGLLGELGGLRRLEKSPDQPITFIARDLASGEPVQGWRYAIYLPEAGDAPLAEDLEAEKPRARDAKAADAQERHFVAYAWPATGSEGLMFGLTESGQVYETSFTGEPPAWNALFGGGSWGTPAVWQVTAGRTAPVEAPAQDDDKL